MEIKLDLHVHSCRSHDGRMTRKEIAALARKQGLDAVAVCDHDVPSEGPGELDGVLFIPGVEFSTELGHMLGLFYEGSVPDCRQLATCADAVHGGGGITVMAHPFEHSTDDRRLLPVLDQLDGVEVWNGRANRKNHRANAMALDFASVHGSPCFAGSDAHLPRELGNGVVILDVKSKALTDIKQALLTAPRAIRGREGRDLDVARSQFTKLRKKHAGVLRYGKWAAFAGVCLWRDLSRPKSNKIQEVPGCH